MLSDDVTPSFPIIGIRVYRGRIEITLIESNSPADSGLTLDLRCIENVLTDYDSQHLQTSESG